MLTSQELTDAYERFDDDRIIRIATFESKSLREIAVPILENEIKTRNLPKELLEWIKLERHFFKGSELGMLKGRIRNSTCSNCAAKRKPIMGFHIHHCSVWNFPKEMKVLLCENCGKKLRNKNYKIAATLGWASKTGFLQVPYYFISELIDSFKFEKISNQIIEDFIFENTGLLRQQGIDKMEKIIQQYNSNQMHAQKPEIPSMVDFI
ncbi:hypothetical protein [Kaistella jeonii]|uniref:Uncharacterized protein n=1 Tax=Kaistella jeonii TaxID=266749 RepID=A0A0C1FJJ9_9FLAO|nr:hypothetical protein [Kaistella jeonii]KIA88079.1 hypothetical protein OA86_12845 [Kaistella jeonii]SFC31851.1 hypothetical protein SAMN05421876_11366 [Kaistella jeonii]VEI95625.1 Uncharacterised protein [Kaistella jeonii]